MESQGSLFVVHVRTLIALENAEFCLLHPGSIFAFAVSVPFMCIQVPTVPELPIALIARGVFDGVNHFLMQNPFVFACKDLRAFGATVRFAALFDGCTYVLFLALTVRPPHVGGERLFRLVNVSAVRAFAFHEMTFAHFGQVLAPIGP